jgi:hypothetical protein
MLDLLLKLLDKVIDLSKRHEEEHRSLFANFAQPAFATFELVHKDALDALTRYGARLADTTFSMDVHHPIFGELEFDAVSTQHLRIKLADFKPATAPPTFGPFLAAIDIYLRGVSASSDHVPLLDKLLVRGHPFIGPDDLRNLAHEEDFRNHVHCLGPPAAGSLRLAFPDPMREALRNVLYSYDAPRDLDEEGERELMNEATMDLARLDDRARRQLCLEAINMAVGHFQSSYALVSSAYAKLRSDLLIPA